jgi:hypothetical protein
MIPVYRAPDNDARDGRRESWKRRAGIGDHFRRHEMSAYQHGQDDGEFKHRVGSMPVRNVTAVTKSGFLRKDSASRRLYRNKMKRRHQAQSQRSSALIGEPQREDTCSCTSPL